MKIKSDISRADRLAKMREKLAHTDTSVGSAGFLRLQDGRNVIRILPEVKTMEFFFQTVGKHVLPPDGKKWFYCPKFSSEGKLECPICEYVEELYKSGDKASKELAGKLRVKRSFWMNAIDRDHENLGVQIFTPGVMVFNSISSMISDPEYGDIYDIEEGIDLIVEKSGKGIDTEYNVKPKRASSPLHEDPNIVKKWLDQAKDLSLVELSDDKDEDSEISKGHAVYVMPYDRLKDEFDSVSDDDYDDDDEDDEPIISRSTAKKKVSSKSDDEDEEPVIRRKAKPADDDDEDDEDDEDEDEEIEREMASRRMARRRPR